MLKSSRLNQNISFFAVLQGTVSCLLGISSRIQSNISIVEHDRNVRSQVDASYFAFVERAWLAGENKRSTFCWH